MLSNEKYKGDALLQKEFTVDYLSKKRRKMKEKCHSTMLKEIMRRLLVHQYLTWCKKN